MMKTTVKVFSMKVFSLILVLVLLLSTFCTADIFNAFAEQSYIDNSSLLPAYKPDEEVALDETGHPDWMAGLIMTQFRIETVTDEGTFQSAVKALDHLAETGVNGVWINPIYEREKGDAKGRNNGYHNLGPRTIEPTLTGADSLEGSYEVVRQFVEEAHKRNIRIFFDFIVWGTVKSSPLVTEHPEFYKQPLTEIWNGWAWNWENRALKDYVRDAAVDLIMKTGADGYRVDTTPDISGYFFKEVKDALLEKGRKIMVMSEATSEHKGAFDIDQFSVGWGPKTSGWKNAEEYEETKRKYGNHGLVFVSDAKGIVDSIKTGYRIGYPEMQRQKLGATFKYYTFNLLHHDDTDPNVKGNRVRIGYQAILAPFIPMWFIGEEWNNPPAKVWNEGAVFFNKIDWDSLENKSRREYYEDVKKYIEIRRSNTDVFEYFPEQLRDTNIEKVSSEFVGVGDNTLQAYARFVENKAFIVVPNYRDKDYEVKVSPDYSIIGLKDADKIKLTDMMNDQVVFEGSKEELSSFNIDIKARHIGIIRVDKLELTEDISVVNKGGKVSRKALVIAASCIVVLILSVSVIISLKIKKKAWFFKNNSFI